MAPVKMDCLLASLIFFTRLPFWRLRDVPSRYFERVVEFWSFVGWLTGGVMALTVILASQVLPMAVAVVLALLVRLLITGSLHEDGLADFCDGMGGGVSRERILEIMKDSHIGTYGVIGLIFYYFLMVCALSVLPPVLCASVMLAGDVFSKLCASRIVNFLPYARAEAKNKIRYRRIGWIAGILSTLAGIAPMFLLPWVYFLCMIPAMLVSWLLFALMRKRIGGYTGDCCGATFLICELSFSLSAVILHTLT